MVRQLDGHRYSKRGRLLSKFRLSGVVAQAALWTPLDTPGVAHWWDGSDGASITLVDNKVSLVRDKVGSADAYQSDPLVRPSMFDGVVQIGAGKLTIPHLDTAFKHRWALLVANVDFTSTNWSSGLVAGVNGYSGASNDRIPAFFYNNNTDEIRASWRGDRSDAGVYLAAGQGIQGFVTRLNAEAHSASVDGSAEQVGGNGITLPTGGNDGLIGDYRSTPIRFAFQTLIIGSEEIGQADVDRLHGWAAHKFGYVERLPDSHPYKESAPVVQTSDPDEIQIAGKPVTINGNTVRAA